MKGNRSGLNDTICAAVEVKEKMKALYGEAAGKCVDKVGGGTFAVLRDMEEEHLKRLRRVQADLAGGGGKFDACRLYDYAALSRSEIMKRIRRERGAVSKACVDDAAAVESGLALENRSIEFFEERLRQTSEPAEREFITHMIAEERSHYILLADLKFYYIDPEHWLMEKARTDLDGAGAIS